MLFLKKLMCLLFISSILGSYAIDNQIPLLEFKTWDELVTAKGWESNLYINENRQKRIFDHLPSLMQLILENFADKNYLDHYALLLEAPSTLYNLTLTSAIEKHCNIAAVFIPADSLRQEETSTIDEQNLTAQNIIHLFNLAKQESQQLLIVIDKINSLFQNKQSNLLNYHIIDTLAREIQNLTVEDNIFVMLITEDLNSCPPYLN